MISKHAFFDIHIKAGNRRNIDNGYFKVREHDLHSFFLAALTDLYYYL